MPPRFISWPIYGGSRRFRDYERVCLDALADALSPEARDVMSRQLAALDVIQRFADDKVTRLHLEQLDPAAKFRDARPALRVARVKLRAQDRDPATATLVAHQGRISTLEFNRVPRQHTGRDVRVERVDVLADPTVGRSEPEAGRLAGVEVPGEEGAVDAKVFAYDGVDDEVRSSYSGFVEALSDVAAADAEDGPTT